MATVAGLSSAVRAAVPMRAQAARPSARLPCALRPMMKPGFVSAPVATPAVEKVVQQVRTGRFARGEGLLADAALSEMILVSW